MLYTHAQFLHPYLPGYLYSPSSQALVLDSRTSQTALGTSASLTHPLAMTLDQTGKSLAVFRRPHAQFACRVWRFPHRLFYLHKALMELVQTE